MAIATFAPFAPFVLGWNQLETASVCTERQSVDVCILIVNACRTGSNLELLMVAEEYVYSIWARAATIIN
jgi:hypothetical protein